MHADLDEPDFGLQIAPILDLLFVILLFLMVHVGTSNREQEMQVNLMGHRSSEASEALQPIIIKIDGNGQVYWNDNPVGSTRGGELPELRGRFKEQIEQGGMNQPFIVLPDKRTRQERIIDVLSAAGAIGVQRLSLGASSEVGQ